MSVTRAHQEAARKAATLKRPASKQATQNAKKPAASQGSRKKTTKPEVEPASPEQGSKEEEENHAEATQHYSPDPGASPEPDKGNPKSKAKGKPTAKGKAVGRNASSPKRKAKASKKGKGAETVEKKSRKQRARAESPKDQLPPRVKRIQPESARSVLGTNRPRKHLQGDGSPRESPTKPFGTASRMRLTVRFDLG